MKEKMSEDIPSAKEIFSIRCPLHPSTEIGEWKADAEKNDHLGYYCYKCKKLVRFNRLNFKEYLTNNFFPVKIL